MTNYEYFVGDEGLTVTVDCGIDISSATAYSIKVKKPDGTTATWTSTIYDSNYLQHTLAEGDLDQSGVYEIKSYIETSTIKKYGNVCYLPVAAV